MDSSPQNTPTGMASTGSVPRAVWIGGGLLCLITAGLAGGYDRRRFIAAAGTVLAAANGKVDENIWMSANMGVALDQQSTFSSSVYANWFQSGQTLAGDGHSIGATAAYSRSITNHLSATAALGVDGISRETLEDIWTASALVGVRYRF